jgi:hypothetical protein
MTRSAPYEKSKCMGSGGSMVARLKLKEIDGRAPEIHTCGGPSMASLSKIARPLNCMDSFIADLQPIYV